MDDLISRQEAIDTILGITPMQNTIPLDSAIFNIQKLPPAQSEVTEEAVKDYCRKRCLTVMTNDCFYKLTSAQPERKTGKWIERWHENKHVIGDMACSVCGTQMTSTFPKTCPSCGADMRGEQDE